MLPAAVAGTARGLVPVPTQQLAQQQLAHENLSASAQLFRAEGFPLFLNEFLKRGTLSAFQVDFLKEQRYCIVLYCIKKPIRLRY